MLHPRPAGRQPDFWTRRKLIDESTLSFRQKAMLHALNDYAGDDGRAYPLRATLATKLSLGKRRVGDILRELKQASIITIRQRGRGRNGQGRSANYEIHWEALGWSPADPGFARQRSARQNDVSPAAECQAKPLCPADGCRENTHLKRTPKTPPPPPPTPHGRAQPADPWKQVEEELLTMGDWDPVTTAWTARRNHAEPGKALEAIAYYRRRPGAWGVGALVTWLRSPSVAILPVDQGWPTPGPEEARLKREARRQQLAEQRAAADERERERREREQRDRLQVDDRQLELRFGSALDAMPRDAARALAASVSPEVATRLKLYGRANGFAPRRELLEAIARREGLLQ